MVGGGGGQLHKTRIHLLHSKGKIFQQKPSEVSGSLGGVNQTPGLA